MNVMTLMLGAAGAPALAILTACATGGGAQPSEYRVADTSRVELTQTLRFPGRSARAYVQYGEVLRRSDVNEWAPYCSFGLNRARDGVPLVREVGPATFTVRNSRVGVDVSWGQDDAGDAVSVGMIRDRGVMLAGKFGGGRGGTPALHVYFTTLSLHSEQQPQVDNLTCAFRGSPTDRNLSLDAIRDTLEGIARVY